MAEKLSERLRAVEWEETDEGDRMPDDPTHKCVFVDMRPNDFRALLREAAAALEAAREDAERWRFVTDEMTYSYGDGNTEPVEYGIHLEWQQGPWIRDGSNGGRGRADVFPGWESIVDAMIAQHRIDNDDSDAAIAAVNGGRNG